MENWQPVVLLNNIKDGKDLRSCYLLKGSQMKNVQYYRELVYETARYHLLMMIVVLKM